MAYSSASPLKGTLVYQEAVMERNRDLSAHMSAVVLRLVPFRMSLGHPDRSDKPAPCAEGHSPSLEHEAPQILLVDDDPVLLESLADLINLRMPRARLTTCLSGTAALGLAAASDFHAIITDIKMPEMDGLTLMTELRQRRPSTPIIVITGHGDQQLRAKAVEFGAFAFIQKPLNRDLFIASLQQALVQRVSRGEGTA
jgi:CheY-like chemotaxis protein